MPRRTLKIASCKLHLLSTKEQSLTFLLFVFSWHLVTLIQNWAKQLKNEYTRTVSLWCAYTFQEEKGNFCCCEGNFLHTFSFVMDTLVPWKPAIMKPCCLQTFVSLTEQASFLLTSSTIFSSLERPPSFSSLPLWRNAWWLARACRVDCDGMPTHCRPEWPWRCLLSHVRTLSSPKL